MDAFRDPTGVMRAAVVALYAYLAFDLADSAAHVLYPPDPVEGGLADLVSIPNMIALLACLVLVGRWIYRTNANAHLFRPVSITPGWAVGWFFIPFANLIKPYEGMSETWHASHDAAGLGHEAETSLLRWWWGLWLATNILSSLASRIDGGGLFDAPSGEGLYVELVSAMLNVPLCLVLIRLMRRLTRVQLAAHHGGTFA